MHVKKAASVFKPLKGEATRKSLRRGQWGIHFCEQVLLNTQRKMNPARRENFHSIGGGKGYKNKDFPVMRK